MDATDRQSILSHGEREIAAMLAAGKSVDEIAAARDDPTAVVEKSVDRIGAKTERAVATLLQSPFTEETLRTLDESERATLRAMLTED